MSDSGPKPSGASIQFWLVAVFLVILFTTGGSSRGDVLSLAVLYPMSILFCALALWTLRVEHLRQNRVLFIGMGAAIMLALMHLIPLPPAVWHLWGGTTDVLSVRALTGDEAKWQSLTPVRSSGWQAALALATPLAIILLGVQLGKADMFRLLPVLIALFSLSGFIGLLQAIGDPNGSLYFYRITNNGSAVGLFANRNHAATLLGCLFPMLAVYSSAAKSSVDRQRSRQLWCAAIAVVIIPLILITGSRSGLIAGVVGLAGAGLLYHTSMRQIVSAPQVQRKAIATAFGGVVVAGLAFVTYRFSRAEAVERLFLAASDQNRRADFVGISADLFWKYYPAGIGSGSFAEVYQVAEPIRLLNPTRLNRVHNDWVEFAVTFGLPGLFFMAVLVALFVRQTYRLWRFGDSSRQSVIIARMAGIAISIVALASLSDYPVRTPIIMSVCALFTLWFIRDVSRSRQASGLAYQVQKYELARW